MPRVRSQPEPVSPGSRRCSRVAIVDPRHAGPTKGCRGSLQRVFDLEWYVFQVGTDGRDRELAARFAEDFDVDSEVIVRQAVFDPVGPFQQRDAIGIEILFRAKLEELVVVFDAIDVEVIERLAAEVSLHDDKRRADDIFRGNTERVGHRFDKARLAGPQRAVQGHHSTRRNGVGQDGAQLLGIVFGSRFPGNRAHDGLLVTDVKILRGEAVAAGLTRRAWSAAARP